MIIYKKHKYSVPIKYIGKYLTVKEKEDILNIYYTTDSIVSHIISSIEFLDAFISPVHFKGSVFLKFSSIGFFSSICSISISNLCLKLKN